MSPTQLHQDSVRFLVALALGTWISGGRNSIYTLRERRLADFTYDIRAKVVIACGLHWLLWV